MKTSSELEIHGLRFVCTCEACPEQYDVLDGGEQVAYIRLRHGELSVERPAVGGERLLEQSFDKRSLGRSAGQFKTAAQRREWLERIALQLLPAAR